MRLIQRFDPDTLERSLRKFRLECGISAKRLAEKVGTNAQAVYRVELGYENIHDYHTGQVKKWIEKACDLLGTTVEEAFPREICTLSRGELLPCQQADVVGHHQPVGPEESLFLKEVLDVVLRSERIIHKTEFMKRRVRLVFEECFIRGRSLVDVGVDEGVSRTTIQFCAGWITRAIEENIANIFGGKEFEDKIFELQVSQGRTPTLYE